MHRLHNPIQPYAWGSRTALASLAGRPVPSPGPEAELWMGAHPAAPSEVEVEGGRRSLLGLIEAAPAAMLGGEVARRFGPRLPFLVKVLAAAEPLSLQAHPSRAQAAAGFAAEEAAGVPRTAPTRNYKDASDKPELICALGDFRALCGFRAVEQTRALRAALGCAALDRAWAPLDRPGGLAETVQGLLARGPDGAFVGEVAAACRALAARGGAFAREAAVGAALAEKYPSDAGVATALLLNLVELSDGEAIYLGAGNLHAYLEGVGVEIMANSDNVLRGGLTPKHVDAAELLRVLDFSDGPVAPIRPRAAADGELCYDTPAEAFALSRFDLDGAGAPARTPAGPEILLAVDGAFEVRTAAAALPLRRGESLFVSPADGAYRVSGAGRLFRARVPAVD